MRRSRPPLPIHRLILNLTSRRFRERHGNAVLHAARQQIGSARERGGLPGAARAWLSTLLDIARAVPGTRLDALGRRARHGRAEAGAAASPHLLPALRAAPRRLLRAPGFTVPAVLSLSLGLGAITAGLSLVDAALLSPLPYADADELLVVMSTRRGEAISVSHPDFRDWDESVERMEAMGFYARASRTLTGEGPARALSGLWVSADLFDILGVAPILGRGFLPSDDGAGAESSVVLSHALWTDAFGADREVLGSRVVLDEEPFTVVGVMPRGFAFPDGVVLGPSDFFVPAGLRLLDEGWQTRSSHPGIYALGRVAPDATPETAREELAGIAAELARRYPETNAEESVLVVGLRELWVGDLADAVVLLAVAGSLVLLVSAANVTGLFLARVSSRRHEVAVRTALGAGRGRIGTLFLAEAIWLTALSGVLGAGIASVGLRLAGPELARFPALSDVSIDPRVLTCLLLLVAGTGLGVGLVPAWRSASARRLGIGSRGGPQPRRDARLQDALVVFEVALAVVLLSTGSILGRSFLEVARTDAGIDPTGVGIFRLGLPEVDYPEWDAIESTYREIESRLASLPGVSAVGAISTLPFTGAGSQSRVAPAGAMDVEPVRTDVHVVTPGYFASMGVSLREGRLFGPEDGADTPPVVVIDERLARRFWPGESPLGRQVDGWGLEGATVVGVVGHVRSYGVLEESREQLYMPHAQRPYLAMWMTVRGAGDPEALAPAVRAEVAAVTPDVPVQTFRSMKYIVDRTVARPRLAAGLGLLFATLAAVLAVSGVYALMAFAVARRKRELGVRMAIGASAGSVRWMVLARASRRAALGVVGGVAIALLGAGLLERFVYGTEPGDPASLTLAGLLLVAASLGAALVPANRASRLDPNRVLREE